MNITKLISDLDYEQTRYETMQKFRQITDPKAAKELMPYFNSAFWVTRLIVAETAGNINNPDLIPYLIPLLIDDDHHVREKAYKALLKFDIKSIPDLVTFFSHRNLEVRRVVSELIVRTGQDGISVLEDLISDYDWIIANRIIETIWRIGGPEAENALIRSLSRKTVQKSAIIFLGEIKSQKAIPFLLDIFHLQSLRNLILNTFINIGQNKSYSYIVNVICTGDEDKQKQAQIAAFKIGKPIVPYLKKHARYNAVNQVLAKIG